MVVFVLLIVMCQSVSRGSCDAVDESVVWCCGRVCCVMLEAVIVVIKSLSHCDSFSLIVSWVIILCSWRFLDHVTQCFCCYGNLRWCICTSALHSLSLSLSVRLSVCLSVSPSLRLSVRPSVRLSILSGLLIHQGMPCLQNYRPKVQVLR